MTKINTEWKVNKITEGLNGLIQYKNKNYGDSAINPLKIFNKVESNNAIEIAIDNKISRIQNAESLRKNDITDLVCYGILLMAKNDWISFEEFKD